MACAPTLTVDVTPFRCGCPKAASEHRLLAVTARDLGKHAHARLVLLEFVRSDGLFAPAQHHAARAGFLVRIKLVLGHPLTAAKRAVDRLEPARAEVSLDVAEVALPLTSLR